MFYVWEEREKNGNDNYGAPCIGKVETFSTLGLTVWPLGSGWERGLEGPTCQSRFLVFWKTVFLEFDSYIVPRTEREARQKLYLTPSMKSILYQDKEIHQNKGRQFLDIEGE